MFITRGFQMRTVQWDDGAYYYQTAFQLTNSSGKNYKATYLAPGVTVYCLLVSNRPANNASSKLANPPTNSNNITGSYYSALGPTRAKHSNSIFGAPSTGTQPFKNFGWS